MQRLPFGQGMVLVACCLCCLSEETLGNVDGRSSESDLTSREEIADCLRDLVTGFPHHFELSFSNVFCCRFCDWNRRKELLLCVAVDGIRVDLIIA